jgi:hypothetical protein
VVNASLVAELDTKLGSNDMVCVSISI